MQEDTLKVVHVRVQIVVNENDYAYSTPRAQKEISFSVPVELFNSPALTKLVERKINETVASFDKEKKEREE